MEKQQRIEIGERLRALREASPHTNRSIADEVGVGERAVANWISGNTGMTYKNAAKVAKLFDVDVVWLWSGQGEQIPGTEEPTSQVDAVAAAVERIEDRLRKLEANQKSLLAEVRKSQRQSSPQPSSQPRSRRGSGGKKR